jgi:Yip1 domain
MQNLVDRMLRAAKMDAALYEEVEADTQATGQAAGVVILSSIAAGIGSLTSEGGVGIIIGTLTALIGWYIWAYMTYFIGTRFLAEPQTHATPGELLRTIGFASTPGILRVVGIIPGLTGIVFIVAAIWMLAAMVIAVKQALDYQSMLRAVGVCAIGWVVQMLIIALFFLLFGHGSIIS